MQSRISQPIRLRRVRSFVRRDSRMTNLQKEAFEQLFERYGVDTHAQMNFEDVFQRKAETILEIGFGMGHSLLQVAQEQRDKNFIGIETHKPGIGNLLSGIARDELTNLRIIYGDASDLMRTCLPEKSLAAICLFFPDPWPKRKHIRRRIIQENFLSLLASKLQSKGELHIATDWADYAESILRVMSAQTVFENISSANFDKRSCYRPLVTKFESRGKSSGRRIWDLQFVKR